jgi:DNA-binding NarL/FixJ family response regulator
MNPKVVLADDHTIVTEGLKALLEPEFQIVAKVDNGRAAIKAVRDFNPDVVILDISMPLLNGIDTAREIRKFDPKIKIVFLTMHTELAYVQEAFDAGASGYVIKHSASIDLQLAIRRALLGRTYITPGVAENGVDALLRGSRRARKSSARLTSRQREVLQLLAEGRSAKEAAAILNLSSRTVEFHKYRLMHQLGLRTTAQLTQFAIKHKIIAG